MSKVHDTGPGVNSAFLVIPPDSIARIRQPFPDNPPSFRPVSPPDLDPSVLSPGGKAWFRDYVTATAEELQVGVGMVALYSLAAVSGAIQDKAVLHRPGETWREPVGIYTLIVAAPGSRKSPAFSASFSPIRAWARENDGALERHYCGWVSRHSALKAVVAKLEKAIERADGNAPDLEASLADAQFSMRQAGKPVKRNVLVDEGTIEALTDICSQQGGYLCIGAPEGDLFNILAGQYSKTGQQANLRLLKSGYSGEGYSTERLGRDGNHIPRVVVTLALATQPGAFRAMGEKREFRDQGLLDRFDYYLEPDVIGTRRAGRDRTPTPSKLRDEYHANLKRLLSNGNPGLVGRWDFPLEMNWTAEALEESYDIDKEVERRLNPNGGEWRNGTDITGYCCKVPFKILRYSALLHAIKYADTVDPFHRPIELSTLAAARDFVYQFAVPQAKAAFSEIEAQDTSTAQAQLLAWVRKHPTWTHKQAQSSLHKNAPFRQPGALQEAEEILIQAGAVRAGVVPIGERDYPCFVTHPGLCLERDHFAVYP